VARVVTIRTETWGTIFSDPRLLLFNIADAWFLLFFPPAMESIRADLGQSYACRA
jgi:hypothetical protein